MTHEQDTARLCERLEEQARSYAAADKMLADAKTARQTDRDDYPGIARGYSSIAPEQTDSWKAAALIRRLSERIEDLLSRFYQRDQLWTANLCDEELDRSGALLGRVRARQALNPATGGRDDT